MSSSSRLPGDRRRALLAALTVAACIAQWLGAMGAGATELSIVTVVPPAQDRQVTLVADVRPAGSTPLPPTAFSVTSGDATLPTSAAPVVSDELALSLVVDASPDGAATLQQGLSGMTSFLLQMPVAARVAAVADSSPPTVLTGLRPGAKDALRALDRLRGGGPRRTSDAIDLALRQLPDDPGPRVLLLLTSAPTPRTGLGSPRTPAASWSRRSRPTCSPRSRRWRTPCAPGTCSPSRRLGSCPGLCRCGYAPPP